MAIQKCEDLDVYNLSFECAVQIFEMTRIFPKEETYSLTDQICRSSRSVAANIREGFAKRKYKNIFIRQLNDALGSSEETITWIDFAFRSKYLTDPEYSEMRDKYEQLGAMIYNLMKKWRAF